MAHLKRRYVNLARSFVKSPAWLTSLARIGLRCETMLTTDDLRSPRRATLMRLVHNHEMDVPYPSAVSTLADVW